MDKKELTVTDLKNLEELIKITESINSLYQKMQDLEMKGQQTTEEYHTLLDYLTIALETEGRQYNSVFSDYDKIFSMVDYLDSEDEVVTIDMIIEGHSNGKVPSRIVHSLLSEVILSKKFANDLIPDKHKQLIKLLGIDEMEGLITDRILSMLDLEIALSRDVTVIYLALLDEFIANPDYAEYLDVLTKAKYDIVFINRDIESEFLANGFVASRTPDLSSELCASLNDIDYGIYDFFKNQTLTDIAVEQINRLWTISDSDYEDKNISSEALLRQGLLRASFVALDDEIIDVINENVHNIIESDDYLEALPTTEISEKNIINSFKKIKSDRAKVKVHR